MKKSIKRIVVICSALALAVTFVPNIADDASATQTKSQIQSQINTINAQQAALQKKIKELEKDASQQEEYQKQLSAEMSLSQQKINTLQSKIDVINSQISDSQNQIAQKEQQIADTTEQFKQRLRTMYMTGNDSTLSIILGSSDFYEMITSADMVKRITAYDKSLVTDMVEQIKSLEAEKDSLNQNKSELDSSRDEIATEVASLSASYEKTSQALSSIEEEQEMADAEYEKLASDRSDFEDQIATIIANEEAARKQQQMQQQQNNNSNYTPTVSAGGFIWPVNRGGTYISSGYGWRTLYGRPDYHQGIDITAGGIYGAPVVATKAGTVMKATWHGAYGYYVMIDHGDGYYSLYAHCSALAVSVGQQVSQGQTISYVGSTGNSTGPHLHFEIWQNGVRVNPSNFVSR